MLPAHPPASDARDAHSAAAPWAFRNQAHYRVSLPVPLLGRVYLAVRVGREKRRPGRLAREGQTRTARLAGAATGLAIFGFGLFCLLYLLKSWCGIDLLSVNSPLHPLYVLFFTR